MNDAHLANYCKALAHPIRVRIVKILLAEQKCITGDLCDRLPVAQSTVSQHLKILRENGLICGEVDGPRRRYCIVPGALSELQALIDKL